MKNISESTFTDLGRFIQELKTRITELKTEIQRLNGLNSGGRNIGGGNGSTQTGTKPKQDISSSTLANSVTAENGIKQIVAAVDDIEGLLWDIKNKL